MNVPIEVSGKIASVLSEERDFRLLAEMGTFQLSRKAKKDKKVMPGWRVVERISACVCSEGQENWVGIQLLIFITVNRYGLLGKKSRLSTSRAPAISLHGCWCSHRIDARTLWPSVDWGGGEKARGLSRRLQSAGEKTQIWLKV